MEQPNTGEPISISPLVSQVALRTLANYCCTYVGNDVYYLVNAINLLISDIGEEVVQKEWEKLGRNWEKTKKNLEKFEKKAIASKSFYDSLEDKKFEKKDKEKEIKEYYFKTASKIPALLPEAYDLLVMMIKMSSIQKLMIPSDAFKILEHSKFQKIEMGTKKTTETKTEKSE